MAEQDAKEQKSSRSDTVLRSIPVREEWPASAPAIGRLRQ